MDGIDELKVDEVTEVAELVALGQDIGRRLNAIPEYQQRLKAMRQRVFQKLRDKGMSYEDIGKLVGSMHRSRVEQITKGLSGSQKRIQRTEPGEADE